MNVYRKALQIIDERGWSVGGSLVGYTLGTGFTSTGVCLGNALDMAEDARGLYGKRIPLLYERVAAKIVDYAGCLGCSRQRELLLTGHGAIGLGAIGLIVHWNDRHATETAVRRVLIEVAEEVERESEEGKGHSTGGMAV